MILLCTPLLFPGGVVVTCRTLNPCVLGSNPSLEVSAGGHMVTCTNCGKSITHKHAGAKFCTNVCQQRYQQRIYVAKWLRTGKGTIHGANGHYIKKHILQEQDSTCALCALPTVWNMRELVLILDHIDGNAQNNNRRNLRCICPNCDSQLLTYKSRNIGKGRRIRRLRYAKGLTY